MADLLRDYLWLWVILVVLLLSTIIILLFICLNRWITRQGKLILGLDTRPPVKFEKYHSPIVQSVPSLKLSTPPLPSRIQFENEVDQSYENLAEEPDYEDPDENIGHNHELDHHKSLPDYLNLESEPEPYCPQKEEQKEEEEEAGNSDYDDITAEDQKDEDEDYDDVG